MKKITLLALALVFSMVSFAQQGSSIPLKTANATISNVTVNGSDVTFTVTPNTDVVSYYYQVWEEGRLQNEVVQYGGTLAWNFWYYNDHYGSQYEVFSTSYTGTETITADLNFWGLNPGDNGEIYILMFGNNNDTVVVSETFAIPQGGGTGTPEISATTSVNCNSVGFDITINDQVANYTVGLYSAATFEEYPTYNNADSMYALGSDNLYYEALTNVAYNGVPAGDYILWVVAANQNGVLVGQSYQVQVDATYTISEPTFAANAQDGALIDVSFDVTNTNDCFTNYSVTVDTDGSIVEMIQIYMEYFGLSVNQALSYLIPANTVTETFTATTETATTEGLQPVTDYYVFFAFMNDADSVVIYDLTQITTPIYQGGEGEAVATLTLNSVGYTSANITLTKNDDTKWTYVLFGPADALTDNEITDCASAYAYASANNMYVVSDLINYDLTNLDQGETYIFYAIPVNANDVQGQCQTITWTTNEMPELLTYTTPSISQVDDTTFIAAFTVTPSEACDSFGATWIFNDVESIADYYGLSPYYVLYRYITSENNWYTPTANQAQNVTVTLSHGSLEVGREVYIYILATIGSDSTYYEIPVTMVGDNGINEVENNAVSLSIYPNPTKENATLSISGLNESATVVLCDMQGRTISSETIAAGTTNTTINTANLESGIYYVRVITANSTRTEKLIKR